MRPELEQSLRSGSRREILDRVRGESDTAVQRTILAAAENMSRADPVRALAILEALHASREMSREASARQALLALHAPAEHSLYQCCHGKIQPEVLGRAFRDARLAGEARAFAQRLATGLSEAEHGHRLDAVVSALAAGGLEARRLAGALLSASPPGVSDDVAEIVLWLALDPVPEVWSHGAVAWGRHSVASGLLDTRLWAALAGQSIDSLAATVPRRTGEPPPEIDQSNAPTVVVQAKSGKKGPGRTGSVLPRRALAALGGLLAADENSHVKGTAAGRSTRSFFEGALTADAVDPWDRASAAFGLLAHPDLSSFSERLARRCRRETLPVLLNVAFVLAEMRAAGRDEIARATLAGLERARSAEELSDWLDAATSLREALPFDAAPKEWTALAATVPGLEPLLRAREVMAGAAGSAKGDAGPFTVLATAEVLAEARRLQGAWRHVEAVTVEGQAVRALEGRVHAIGRLASELGVDTSAGLDAALAAAEVGGLAKLMDGVVPLLSPTASPAERRALGEALWIITHVVRNGVALEQRVLPGPLVDDYQATTPLAIMRRLMDWTTAALSQSDRHPTLYLLRVVSDVAASRPELAQLALRRLAPLLQAPCPVAPDRARAVQRGLARIAALALDVAELDRAPGGGSLATVKEAAEALVAHPLSASGLVDQVRERLRSPRARAVLDTAAQAAAFSQRRNEILLAVAAGGSPDPPGTIDGFAIERLLGRGGFGAVYRCTSERHGVAAVKVCHDLELARGRDFQRFLDEAVLISRLDHPAIPRLLAIGHHGGYPYIAMEFVEGRTLFDRMAAADLSDRERWSILASLGDVLTYARSRDVVHRDLKPSNIIITPGGAVRVLDWGLAHSVRVTPGAAGPMGGTRLYSAPEQFAAGRAGSEYLVDHFAFGRIAMEVLSGRSLMDLVEGIADDVLVPRVSPKALAATGLPEALVAQLLDLAQPDPRLREKSLEPFLETCRVALAAARG